MDDAQRGGVTGEQATLALNLRWWAGDRWYGLRAACEPGLTAVAGPAGPSLLRLLAGYPVPHRGTVRLDGRPPAYGADLLRHGPRARPVASVLVGDRLPWWRTSLSLVSGRVRLHGVPYLLARARAAQALRWVDAGDLARLPVLRLDTAARRRVALAGALANVPGLLLLERPCAPFPLQARAALYATLRDLAEAWSMVVLVIPEGDAIPALPELVPHQEE